MDAKTLLRSCAGMIEEGAGDDLLQWASMVQNCSRIHAAVHDPRNLTRSATQAAEILGMNRETLQRRMSELGGIQNFQAARTWEEALRNLPNVSAVRDAVKGKLREISSESGNR